MSDFGRHRSLSQRLYDRMKELVKASLELVDTCVITVKGWVESEQEKERWWAESLEEVKDNWNVNNHIKPGASYSLISIDCFWMQNKSEGFWIQIWAVCCIAITSIKSTSNCINPHWCCSDHCRQIFQVLYSTITCQQHVFDANQKD